MNNEILENKSEKIAKRKIFSRKNVFDILVFLSVIVFSIIISPKTLQNDTFYTVKCGEYIFNNGIFNLKSDPFSWLDLPYTFPHWLYDFVMYLIFAKAGWDGIYISTIIFSSILGISLYRLCVFKSNNKLVSAVITVLGLYLLEPYIAARAQLITFILFVLEILCIEKFLKYKKIRYGVFLVIIAAIIAEIHVAVFPMFFIFMLPYIGEWLINLLLQKSGVINTKIFTFITKIFIKISKDEKSRKKYEDKLVRIEQNLKIKQIKLSKIQANPYKVIIQNNKNIVLLLIIMIIAGCTGIFNPTGDTAYTYLYKTYKGNTTESINEHQPTVLAKSKEFAIAISIFIFLLTFMDLKITLADLFMLVGVSILAFNSRRQISIFTIAGAPILARIISEFFEIYDSKTCNNITQKLTSNIGCVVVVILLGVIGWHYYEPRINESYIYDNDYPVQASDWILENLNLAELKLFNEYNYGSYLLFRGIPVMIDSRADLYAPEFNDVEGYANAGDDIFNEALDLPSLSSGYEETFEKYGVNHVILYANAKLCLLLDEDENYNMIHGDNYFKIYERLNAKNGE